MTKRIYYIVDTNHGMNVRIKSNHTTYQKEIPNLVHFHSEKKEDEIADILLIQPGILKVSIQSEDNVIFVYEP